jgi:hypothetical protein
MDGGMVIGSGGFGCVFQPSLQCDDKDNNATSSKKKITKLMTKNNAVEEYNIIKDFRSRLKKIKGYDKYFLLKNVSICNRVKRLTKKDLKGYTKRCKSLIKKNITSKNINSSLDKMSAITMPHGGIDLSKYSVDNINNYLSMTQLFDRLSTLLSKGVVSMNKLRVYHGDIKSANILIKDGTPRLIDWGLAFYHKKSDSNIHKDAQDRPFQFNLPPSCVIFNKIFDQKYNTFLSQDNSDTKQSMEIFIKDYLNIWNKERGAGSLDILNYVYGGLLNDKNIRMSDKKVEDVIIKYITNIVDKYTENGNFQKEKYYKDVYLKNLDIWGIVMSCVNIFDLMNNSKDTLNTIESMVLENMRDMFKYTLENDTTAMDPKVIEGYLKEISEMYSTIKMEKAVDNTQKHENISSYLKKTTKKKTASSKASNKIKTRSHSKNTRKLGKKYF